MKKSWILIGAIAVLLAVVMILVGNSDSRKQPAIAQDTHDSHPPSQAPTVKTVPSHYTQAPNRASLRPTLEPESSLASCVTHIAPCVRARRRSRRCRVIAIAIAAWATRAFTVASKTITRRIAPCA